MFLGQTAQRMARCLMWAEFGGFWLLLKVALRAYAVVNSDSLEVTFAELR